MRTYLSSKVSILMLMLFVAAGTHAQAVRELRPGALLDTQNGLAFVMGPDGVDAIQIRSGAALWHSDHAKKPIALQGQFLIAQAATQEFGQLQLVILDAETGSQVRSSAIELPSKVFALTTDTVGSSFDVWADPAQGAGEEVQIAWRFEYRVAQGIAPTADTPAPVRQSGSFRFNPRTGASTPLADGVERLQERFLAEKHQRIEGVAGRQFVETSGDHILASDKATDASAWDKYQWTVYSSEGQRLGALDTFVSFAPFVVEESLLLFETPPFTRLNGDERVASGPMLRAVALANGVEQWAWPLQDTTYRGPFPP